MKDQDLIRKAFDLADGWEYEIEAVDPDYIYLSAADGTYWHMDEESIPLAELPRIFVDALAAQLVRQVDALSKFAVDSDPYGTAKVWERVSGESLSRISKSNDSDRTMNTIRAIVESGVLPGSTRPLL